ncbi:MAG: helix-turn-helix transcriptional regulator [Thermus sp.]|uniref:winged helix-turn-helix transcriptional regulator n=1 Tax=unclassified Thermus TaxID=2619321 RepID=UPI00023898B7|nr:MULTISPECIES: helix-turn-helix domain-containing protein [unclassified Thermus]AEV15890.1 Transcriptional regulator, HxlR [Thermus sp. CCB_US3_UF1]MCS6869347.1 helix-turn-helix transcriptional regulator [Thermus sp.]MCS7217886.1 helix-turn-helix transcriptional regulator [Thermus sp.]MCX7850123.1 helix-turn-helix transcriptional regulator [Thermus sp.]MDW8016493.1 winged helix-turn-helix transcriptional regulator [Thermus sp.]
MALTRNARKVLKVLARRGAPEVLLALSRGASRFSDLESSLLLSPRTLAERLREFHLLGLVDRRAFPEVPPRVEYTLTPRGRRVLDFLHGLEEVLDMAQEEVR